jgi:branched-chain amino acid transport system ATP-binding protein
LALGPEGRGIFPKLALQTCQRVYVIDGGRIALEGQADELLHNEQVQKVYLGE